MLCGRTTIVHGIWPTEDDSSCAMKCAADSNSNFGVLDFLSKSQFDFLCVRVSLTHNVTAHVHVFWLVCIHVLIRCRHTADRHTQTTYAVQADHASIATAVVSLMTHSNLLIV